MDGHLQKLHLNLKLVLYANDKPGGLGFDGSIELSVNKQSRKQHAQPNSEESCGTDHLPLPRRPKKENPETGKLHPLDIGMLS